MNKQHTQGTILDFGHSEYRGTNTFYLVLQNEQGQNLPPVRGKGLEEAFKQVDNLQKGDSVNLRDMGIDEVTKKRMWEVERHEPYQKLENAIERDVERDLQKVQIVDKTNENDEKTVLRPKEHVTDLGEDLPDSIKNNYVGISKNQFMKDEKVNYYDKSDPDKVNIAFEDRKNSLNTSRQDDKTVKAMMDLAESKGWTAIKLKGTEEFKQKAWVEASLRGIETKGYEPNEKDKAELIAKQESRTVNQVEATAIKEAIQKEIPEIQAEVPQTTLDSKEPITQENIPEIDKLEVQPQGKKEDISLNNIDETTKQNFQDNNYLQEQESLYSEQNHFDHDYEAMYQDYPFEHDEKTFTDKDIKAQIREITQNGYKDGSITNRNALLNVLTDHGYEVVKENEKSIRLKVPYSDQHLTLKGEMFTKDFDALKQLKASLEPEAIKERFPQISDTGIAQITAWKNHVLEKYETPQAQQEVLNRLETSVVDVANGKDLGMPKIPDNEIQPDVQIQIGTTDKSRSR